jgi:hypothetical protein
LRQNWKKQVYRKIADIIPKVYSELLKRKMHPVVMPKLH